MPKNANEYIVFPLDVPTLETAEKYVTLLDGKIGVFKVGLELFISNGPNVLEMIRQKSSAKIFLDLKLHDISATVQRAMERVSDLGVDYITVHCSSSKAMLEKAVAGARGKTEILGVTVLTDNDAHTLEASGFQDTYINHPDKLVMKRAKMAHEAGCSGVICSGKEAGAVKKAFGSSFLAVTPGIRPEWSILKNDDQKRVVTPGKAVQEGSDLIVIGRPIRDAVDPVKAAEKTAHEIQAVLS